jgi:flagellar motor switch/type III secretory pathway protein FliN
VVLYPAAGAVPLACLGRLAARVELGAPASITLTSGFSEELMASDILDHAEVDLVVHLGHVVVSARQLAALAPGAVLELDRPLGGPVELYVGKTLVGRGEVVDIDGQLGVRVTERA